MTTSISSSSVSYWSNYSGAFDFTQLTQLAASFALARSGGSSNASSSSSYAASSTSSGQVSAASGDVTNKLAALLVDIDGKLTEVLNFQKAQSASLPDAGGYGVTSSQANASYFSAQNAAAGASAALDGSNTFIQQVSSYISGNTLDYNGAVAILNAASSGGMGSTKLAGLQQIAQNLNGSGSNAIATSDYVRQMFANVVLGNTRNDAVGGNLTAASTSSQVDALIGKWFGGKDNPTIDANATYQDFSNNAAYTLYATGAPRAADINQGNLADSAFLGSLAALASSNPSAVQDMITDNHNGTYGVRFYLNGQKQYVTVDGQFAVMNNGVKRNDGGDFQYSGGANGSLWGQIVEKAYAEFLSEVDGGSNSMANLAADGVSSLSVGLKEPLADFSQVALQNASTTHYSLNADSAADGHYAAMKTFLGNQISTALSAGQIVTLDSISGGNTGQVFDNHLVGNHRFAVVGYNSNTQTVTLDNPWNANGTITAQFSMELDDLASAGVRFNVNGGAIMTA